MANDNGSSGVLGVLIGALIVVVIGGLFLFGTGQFGNQSTVKLELPKVSGTK